jgi:hypothetical protein
MSDKSRLQWLVRRTAQQLGQELLRKLDEPRAGPPTAPGTQWQSEIQRFQTELENLSESDMAIYGTVLAGLEDRLMSPQDLVYREVLDHLAYNVGTLLDDLGCFDIFGGQVARSDVDLTWAPSLRARVALDVMLPLEQTRRRLRASPVLARFFEGHTPYLGIHRLYRPRLLRRPDPEVWTYGLFGRNRTVPQDVTYLSLRQLPDTAPTTRAEVPIIIQHTRLRDIVLSDAPARQEILPRLQPADFMALLQGLLLDARTYCHRRAHDQQELEQLNRVLFNLLARSGTTPDTRSLWQPHAKANRGDESQED